MNSRKIDWVIHYVSNNAVCEVCGKRESNFIPKTCNAHTDGMYKHDHMEFQLVLDMGPQEIMRILNTFGLMVLDGRRFHDGEFVSGIYEDCDVRLSKYLEEGKPLLRVIIPDKYNIFPEDKACMDVYRLQLLPTEELYLNKGSSCTHLPS